MKGYKYTQERKGNRAIPFFRKIQDAEVAMRDYILYYLGRELLGHKQCQQAREVFTELVDSFPESRWAALAEIQKSAAEACPPLEIPVASDEKTDCAALVSREKKADCYFNSRSYLKAKELYRILSRGRVGRQKKVYYLTRLSQAAARSQDFETAIGANKILAIQYRGTKVAREALWKIASLYQVRGDYREAILAFRRLVESSRSPQERRHYWERIGWCHFRLEEYPEAISSFDSGLSEEETSFLLYWKARSLERLGSRDKAHSIHKELIEIYPERYYGLRSLERLYGREGVSRQLKRWWHPIAQGLRWRKGREIVSDATDLKRIYQLASLGLLKDAEIEVRRTRARLRLLLPSNPKKIRQERGGFSYELRIPEREDEDFPLPYADFLFSEARAKEIDLDPFLLYGMMRQESRVQDGAVSSAGAVGVMQIMPTTGRRLANESQWDGYQSDWLYDPATNLELSILYMDKLSGIFGGKWYAMAAAYNAGERVVKTWLEARKGLPEDEFIEEIPYAETKDYVKKVYTNWKAYQSIYGGS